MKYMCCFCGKTIDSHSFYSLFVQQRQAQYSGDEPGQELFCHRECMEAHLADSKLLYLNYLREDDSRPSASPPSLP